MPIFASHTLPYGTIVEAINPKNGRKVRLICYDYMASKTKNDVAPKYLNYLCGKRCSGFKGELRIIDTSHACKDNPKTRKNEGQSFKCMRSERIDDKPIGAYLDDKEVKQLGLGIVK